MKPLTKIKNWMILHPLLTIIVPVFILIGSVSFVKVLDRTKIHRKKPIEYIIIHYTANNHEKASALMNAKYLQRT